MRVVFEGPDNGGKSTLARIVADKLNFNYRGRILRQPPEQIVQANYTDLDREGNWIFDRCYWMTNRIYEPITHGMISEFCKIVREAYDIDDIYYIHVTCSEELIASRLAALGDDIVDLPQSLAAKRSYDKFFTEKWDREYLCVDTTFNTPEFNAQLIIDKINYWSQMQVVDGKVLGCGVIVLNEEGHIALGHRIDGQGWSLAGGKIEPGEHRIDAARRELREEFGIAATQMTDLGTIDSEAWVRGRLRKTSSSLFLCTQYEQLDTRDKEMSSVEWRPLEDIMRLPNLFKPTRDCLEYYIKNMKEVQSCK